MKCMGTTTTAQPGVYIMGNDNVWSVLEYFGGEVTTLKLLQLSLIHVHAWLSNSSNVPVNTCHLAQVNRWMGLGPETNILELVINHKYRPCMLHDRSRDVTLNILQLWAMDFIPGTEIVFESYLYTAPLDKLLVVSWYLASINFIASSHVARLRAFIRTQCYLAHAVLQLLRSTWILVAEFPTAAPGYI